MNGLLAERAGLLGLNAAWVLDRDAPGTRHCRLLQAADGWVALNLARGEDRDLISACFGTPESSPWQIAQDLATARTTQEFRDLATELQLPAAILGEAGPFGLTWPAATTLTARVVDLSALWAGPLCAGLLARAGAKVVRIDSIGRPDPTPVISPRLDARINGGKSRLALDLRTNAGRAALMQAIDRADIVVTSARASALRRLGLEPDRMRAKTWVAITAHGWASERVGFGDDAAVAGGLVDWHDGMPGFRGDALADPLTGLEAALAILAGARGLIDMAMAQVAATYAAAR